MASSGTFARKGLIELSSAEVSMMVSAPPLGGAAVWPEATAGLAIVGSGCGGAVVCPIITLLARYAGEENRTRFGRLRHADRSRPTLLSRYRSKGGLKLGPSKHFDSVAMTLKF